MDVLGGEHAGPRPLGDHHGPFWLDEDFFEADAEITDLFLGTSSETDAAAPSTRGPDSPGGDTA